MNILRRRPSYYNSRADTLIKTIIVDRGDCYSNLCPSYRVEIDVATGNLRYYGRKNVKRIGLRRGKVSSYHISLLVEFIESTGFFRMNAEYSSGWVDMQMTKITIVLKNGQRKTVSFDDLARPPQLIAIRLMVQYAMANARWPHHQKKNLYDIPYLPKGF